MAPVPTAPDDPAPQRPPRFSTGPPGSGMVAYLRDPLALFQNAAKAHGDVVQVSIGPNDIFLVSRPELAREVLVTRRHNYGKPSPLGDVTPALGLGLQTSDGYYHQRQRALTEPAMSPTVVERLGRGMVERAVRLCEQWQDDAVVDVHSALLHMTFTVVGWALFGIDVDEDAPQVEPALEAVLESCQRHAEPFADLRDRLPLRSTRQLTRGHDELHRFLDERIASERHDGGARGSILSMLLSATTAENPGSTMTDAEARDEATIMFLAGRETIGDVLAWTWYEVVRHTAVATRLHAEVDSVLAGGQPTTEALADMPYLNRVVHEGLRLYPVGWAVLRQTVAADRLGDYSLPAGAYVLVSPWVMHRDTRFFTDPTRFDPERWPDHPAAEPAAFMPFSIGARSCVGEHLARLALPLLLATMAQRWTAEPIGAPVKPEPTFAVRPKGGMKMRLSRRRDQQLSNQ